MATNGHSVLVIAARQPDFAELLEDAVRAVLLELMHDPVAEAGKTICQRMQACAITTRAFDCDTFANIFSGTAFGRGSCSSYDAVKAATCLDSLGRFPCICSSGLTARHADTSIRA